MFKLSLLSLLTISLFTQSCATEEADSPIEVEELENGLNQSKADAVSGIEVFSNGITFRKAAARTLYNLLDSSDATVATGNGTRTLYANGLACITNGLENYCVIRGNSQSGNSNYEGIVHGNTGARTLFSLLSQGGNESFVSTPWFACEKAGSSHWCGVETSESVMLEFDGLEDSGDDFVYEGWAVHDGVATTTDRFRSGEIVFQQIPSSIADATADADDVLYILTIEPRRGDAAAPADTHLMAGKISRGLITELTIGHAAALGTDFSNASGGYILATPTSDSTDDEEQGIWFVNPAAGEPSLSLPTLPKGWAYEGWVVGADGPVSTGTFTTLTGDDSDGAGSSAGPNMSPPFPGQDFVSPPMNVVGSTIVISVEPVPDNSSKPFAIKPLIDSEATPLAPPALQELANTHENTPRGTASLGL